MENYIKVKFSDYFSASLPHYKNFSDLKRDKAYYLSNIHNKLDNYINNPNYQDVPINLLDDILVVELQKYDTMIDINGNLYDWSGSDCYSPIDRNVENKDNDWFGKSLTAVNHVIFDDILDVKASILYNLIEIQPISREVSIEYLRYYFWYRKWDLIDQVSNGQKFLDHIYDTFCAELEKETGNTRYLYTCELINQSEMMIIDNFDNHTEKIREHCQYIREQVPNSGRIAIQSQFGSPLYQNLERLEKQIQNQITGPGAEKILPSFTGFLFSLEEGQANFDNIKANGGRFITAASLSNFSLSCEIILRAKLKLIDSEIEINSSFYNLIEIVERNINWVLKKGIISNKKTSFVNILHKVRKIRNKGAHTGEMISLPDAQNIIDLVCKAIWQIDEYIIERV